MKRISITLLILVVMVITSLYCNKQIDNPAEDSLSFYVANWNVENLFDTVDDPEKNDEWFLPTSEIKWTERKLINKLANLARVIDYMNNGNGPDLLGIEEVENQGLLIDLVDKYLKKPKYKIAYSESPDDRGIDNGLIYNSDKFGIESINPLRIQFEQPKSSRDILFVQLVVHETKEVINVFVNHWPSRREGLKESEKFRINAAEALLKQIDLLKLKNPNPNVIILGDFNDLPSNISIRRTLGAQKLNCDSVNIESFKLYNLTYNEFQKGNGTYKYKNDWNMLDQIIISSALLDNKHFDYLCNSFEIIKPDFIIQKSGKYEGTPLPTFGGKKYLGGYSDHFPIGAKFILHENKN